MRIMLRLLAIHLLFITIIVSTISHVTAFAASNTYDLDELNLQVTIPSGYSVVTRNTPASDPIFNDFGTTQSALISQFETSNIYLNAISNTYNEEIVVTNTKNNLSSFNLLSDTVLNTIAETMANQYTDYGINVSKYEIYQHSQAKFIKVYFTNTANTVHGLQYYTVYDGNAMNFTMRSYESTLSYRQESTIKTIVDSIKYDKAPPVADQGEDTNSFIHTDTDSGVKFTVPANWKQEAFSRDREFIDIKFVSTKEDGCTMIYGSTDMWGQMSASDRVGYTRSDINNSVFTKSDIAGMYSTTTDKISTVTYNGVEYFKGETNYTSDTYGVDITVKMTQLVYIDNGWMYIFQFGGTSSHKLYSDFETLLNSVQYPTPSNVEWIGSSNDTSSGENILNSNSDDTSGVVAVVVLTVFVVMIVIAGIIYNKKTSQNIKQAYNTPTGETPIIEEPTVTCKNCGHTLPLDSTFCHICGTKINMEGTDS